MKKLDYQIEALKYIIPYFRSNEDIVCVLKAIGERFNTLQEAVIYMLDSLNIHKARGVWLDYAGAEVGASRDEVDYGSYFCVNREHINTEKRFYFLTSGINPESPLSLNDAESIQKILAYIGANSSCGTRNEIINIVQTITNAQSVIVTKKARCVLGINLVGDRLILTKNTINYIQQIIGDGIYLEEITLNGKTN